MNLKRGVAFLIVIVLATAGVLLAQNADLEKVLKAMDQQSAGFHSAQADFVWDQYTKVVDDHDLQQGTIYFRRVSKDDLQMAADIKQPPKYVLFGGGLVKVYDHGGTLDQVTEYNAGKNKAAFESFLVLGFGGGGHDMQKSFDVKYAGTETVMGVNNAAKLELTPKAQNVRNMFDHIILWIDPARGISVQQQFLTRDGDYRLAKYKNIVLNGKISDDVFKLKTTSKTTTVRPQG